MFPMSGSGFGPGGKGSQFHERPRYVHASRESTTTTGATTAIRGRLSSPTTFCSMDMSVRNPILGRPMRLWGPSRFDSGRLFNPETMIRWRR